MSSIGIFLPIDETTGNLQLQINHFNTAGIIYRSPRNEYDIVKLVCVVFDMLFDFEILSKFHKACRANRDISGILEAFWKTIMGQPVRTGLDPRELGNCSGPQGFGDMRLEKLLSICQPIIQQWHAAGSFGTLGCKDKRRPGTLEHHSPSFIARIH